MNLKSFNKNQKRNKIIIGSVIGILLVIGSFIIYKTYAFYEEKKSFNVLKGRIPDFGYDIKMLSVVIDEKKSETIHERGMYKTNVYCTNGTIEDEEFFNKLYKEDREIKMVKENIKNYTALFDEMFYCLGNGIIIIGI